MIFNLYKPRAVGSNEFLSWFKRKFNITKAGFLGTLDPLAEGVLPIFTGEATKLIGWLDDDFKGYRFTTQLGWHSDSLDAEGFLIRDKNPLPVFSAEKLNKILSKMSGEIKQIPPKKSALKFKGTRLYQLARRSEKFNLELKERNVTLYKYKINGFTAQTIDLSILCSKGFYVRSLMWQITQSLSTVGFVSYLCRESVAKKFLKTNAIKIDSLLKTQRISDLKNIAWQDIFADYPVILIENGILWKKVCAGQKIDVHKLDLGNNNFLKTNLTNDQFSKNEKVMLFFKPSNSLCLGVIEYIPQALFFRPKRLLSYIR